MSQYAPGAPSFVDLASPDVDASLSFYGDLFGWTDSGVLDPVSGYRMFLDDGQVVAGLVGRQSPGQPISWTVSVTVENVDASVETVREQGGTVLMEGIDVFDAGRMAIFLDPTGGYLAIWEPRRRAGADKVGEPVSLGWVELRSRDLARAAGFYAAVFGWEAQESDGYTRFLLGDRPVAGGLALGAEVPEEIPSHWMAYFSVADVDATATRAAELGAHTHHPPTPLGDAGRFAVLGDPQGAPFALLAMAS